MPGRRLHLSGGAGAVWVRDRLPRFSGTVVGYDALKAYSVRPRMLEPKLRWTEQGVDLAFSDGEALVGARRALSAWRHGESLIPLADHGFAPLPTDWLDKYGEQVAMLLDAADQQEDVPAHLAPVAAELFRSTGAKPPPDLKGLVEALRESDGLPEIEPPSDLHATLRDYQLEGYRWLHFLAGQRMGAVLADDMGLGKTVQCLAMLLARKDDGPSLVEVGVLRFGARVVAAQREPAQRREQQHHAQHRGEVLYGRVAYP